MITKAQSIAQKLSDLENQSQITCEDQEDRVFRCRATGNNFELSIGHPELDKTSLIMFDLSSADAAELRDFLGEMLADAMRPVSTG